MFLVELILIALVACFALAGSKRGLIQSVGQIVGVIAGFAAARAFAPSVAGFVGGFFPGRAGLLEIVVFTMLFLFVERIVGWVLHLIGSVFRLIARWNFLNKVGSFLGGVLGTIEGALLIGGVIYWIRLQHLDPTVLNWLSSSQVAGWLEGLFRASLGFLL